MRRSYRQTIGYHDRHDSNVYCETFHFNLYIYIPISTTHQVQGARQLHTTLILHPTTLFGSGILFPTTKDHQSKSKQSKVTRESQLPDLHKSNASYRMRFPTFRSFLLKSSIDEQQARCLRISFRCKQIASAKSK